MKKRMRKMTKCILGVVMAVCLMFCTCIDARAAAVNDEVAVPASIDATTSITLSFSTSGTATCICTVTGSSNTVSKISITMYLQKKAGSGKYYNTNTWSGTQSGSYYRFKKTASVTAGTYRVMAKITCYNGSTSETTYRYSAAKTY